MDSNCICVIPRHWPKHEVWAHVESCPWRLRAIELLRERWS